MLTKPDTAESNPTREGWGPIQSSVIWKTYTNKKYGFEFKYPNEWIPSEKSPDTIEFKDRDGIKIISIYSIKVAPDLRELTYCDANFNDVARCQQDEVGGYYVTIDWGTGGAANIIVGNISFTLHKVSPETKILFRNMLHSLKFLF